MTPIDTTALFFTHAVWTLGEHATPFPLPAPTSATAAPGRPVSQADADRLAVFTLLCHTEGGATRSAFYALRPSMNAARLTAALDSLLADGLIETSEAVKCGRTLTLYQVERRTASVGTLLSGMDRRAVRAPR